ncbi:hypothetical protein [Porphyrobacter sp. AAP82]|uniref:hypothetical protein n=1 Tax=Porphyrobacter sp. AAP82 TaxID=1248917 RepID=UPI0002FD34E9|nr:hypothetical protein [Porphyrobacter sp. AAP82]
MSGALDSREAARDFALTLPGTVLAKSYGKPAVKGAASFVLHIDIAAAEMLMATGPATFWQTPHYESYGAVLVRFASPDPERVQDTIRQAHAPASTLPAVPRCKR